MDRIQVWSCGGGTQSAAIAALIIQGKLPCPDLAVIVDTGREKQSTWDYLDRVVAFPLSKIGIELHRISKQRYATVDLYSPGSNTLLLPAFTSKVGEGKLTNWCSHEWKRRVLMRWLRDRGVECCDNWIGISCDEARRIRASSTKWFHHKYPLIDLRIWRSDCYRIVQEIGWPPPPRSSCWMCPNMADAEWREMKENYPADFAAAVAIEKELRQTDPHIFLHRSMKTIDQVDFTDYQEGLFDGCASGHCFV